MLEQFHVPEQDRVYVEVDRMRASTEALFMHCGLDEAGAKACTDVLITNDLRAVESHGVSNMMRNYVASYMAGNLNPRPELKTVRETATTANVDADGALGIHIGGQMMQIAIDKAKEYGTGAVTVFDSGHLGGCGYYAAQAAQQGMVGLCMTGGHGTRASGGMLPTFAAESRLGTNPIAWAAPARNQHPFLFDVACTQIANNKVGLARRIGVPLEPGWITDTDGNPFNEPVTPPDEYFLLPFGGTRENGSHKGYGFAAVCAIMCQTLAGVGIAGTGNEYQGGYHFFAAFQIEAFSDHDEFLDNMDDALATSPGTPRTRPRPCPLPRTHRRRRDRTAARRRYPLPSRSHRLVPIDRRRVGRRNQPPLTQHRINIPKSNVRNRDTMEREYVNFGKGGVMVTRMALGLGFRGQNDADEAKKTISTALDGGLNLIDCANIYGLGDSRRNAGTSEIILGELMQDRGDRDDIVITSKVSSPVAPGVNDHNTSRWHIMREVDRSLKRLQTDRIDVYLIHHFDETVGYEERTRALEDLVRDGKIRYTGLCNYQAWQVVQTLRVQDRINASNLVTVQNPYSMLNRELEDEMFPMVRHTGLGIMAYSPLAVGLLSGDYSAEKMPESMSLWGNRRAQAFDRVVRGAVAQVIRTNVEVAKRVGATPAQVAQAWVLSHPEITISISGADTAEQMEDNLGALEIQLPTDELATLNDASDRLRIALDGAGFEEDQ